MNFSKILVYWYLQNKRDLPWRKTNNPYYIWLSEIILQQTRIDQGIDYYLKFVNEFPTIKSLANASEEKILKLWQGLGYYSRARNLHYSANYIVNEFGGKFPATYKELLQLKGVGDYTASAIASICFNEVTAVVDGNVYRVLARYFGISTPINNSKGIKEFKILAQELIDVKIPGTYNQAIMEFGAIMCKPKNPSCEICPLNLSCVSLEKNKVNELPVKENKIKIRKRFFNYLVIRTEDDKTKLVKRTKGIWLNMYEFPLIETEAEIDENQLLNSLEFEKIMGDDSVTVQLFNKKAIIHKLSHQHINTKFWIVKVQSSPKFKIGWENVDKYPVSILVDNFLKQFNTNCFF